VVGGGKVIEAQLRKWPKWWLREGKEKLEKKMFFLNFGF
jgi:pterin-4a-carbinolamine dehydratase